MPYVEVSKIIKAKKKELYEIIKRMEDYPQFMADVLSVEILEKGNNNTITSWLTSVDGRKIKWKELDQFDDEKCHIAYKQIAGDLRKFEGEWILEETEEGTKVLLTVDFDFGIPMIAPLLNPILKKKVKQNSENMLESIRQKTETISA